MIYECRFRKITNRHVFGALCSVLALFLADYFGVVKIAHWSAYAIGITFVFVILYLIENTMVRLEIDDESVTIYHSGMVQGNIPRAMITGVERVGHQGRSAIVISTSDSLEFSVPVACFAEAEVDKMLRDLKKI